MILILKFRSGTEQRSPGVLNRPAGGSVWPAQGWTGSGWPPAPQLSRGRRSSGRPAVRCLPGYSTVGRRSSAPWLRWAQRAASSPSDDLRQRRKNESQQVRCNLGPLDRVDANWFRMFPHILYGSNTLKNTACRNWFMDNAPEFWVFIL